jgi:hypothetical protein
VRRRARVSAACLIVRAARAARRGSSCRSSPRRSVRAANPVDPKPVRAAAQGYFGLPQGRSCCEEIPANPPLYLGELGNPVTRHAAGAGPQGEAKTSGHRRDCSPAGPEAPGRALCRASNTSVLTRRRALTGGRPRKEHGAAPDSNQRVACDTANTATTVTTRQGYANPRAESRRGGTCAGVGVSARSGERTRYEQGQLNDWQFAPERHTQQPPQPPTHQ